MRRFRFALASAAGAAIAAGAFAVVAQPPTPNQTAGEPTANVVTPPPPAPVIEPPPQVSETNAAEPTHHTVPANSLAGAQAPPAPPPLPPKPIRSPFAVLRALDKVTTETMQFAAPVGGDQRVRYKNLVFTVKACETSGVGQADPQSAAYVVIDSAPLGQPGERTPAPKEVYRGWMYANSPTLHPFQHPIYDAWLIACMASAPPA